MRKNAMKRELKSVEENEIWEKIDCPENVDVIDNKWIFSLKQ